LYTFIAISSVRAAYAIFMVTLQIKCTNMLQLPNSYGLITGVMSSVTLFAKTGVFIALIVMMKKFNHREYKRNWKPLSLYFIIDFVAYFTSIYIYTIERVSPKSMRDPDDLPNDHTIDWFHITVLIFYLVNIPHIILGYAIIYFKDQKDMI
jgi:hypothetical protein